MSEEMVIEIESVCIDCGWKGVESEHSFLNGWHVCPTCHQAEFLLSGEEAEDVMEKDTLWYLGNS